MAKRTTKRSRAGASAPPELTVRKLELTTEKAPLLTLECPDLSSGRFTFTMEGTFVTTVASSPATRPRKR